MVIFIIFLVVVVIAFVIFYTKEKDNKLKEEKDAGVWDFINDEYLPYLKSHSEPVKKFENVKVKLKYSFDTWNFPATVYCNAAGVFIPVEVEFPTKNPSHRFFRGKEIPAKFKPRDELFYDSMELKKNDLHMKFKLKENGSPDYTIIIYDISDELKNELLRILK